MDDIKKFEAVYVKYNGGDFDIVECKTFREARKALKNMIKNEPFSDAYIREFRYSERYGDFEAVRDYNI